MRPKILDGPKHGFYLCRNGANDHEQPRSVPFGSTRSNRIKTRPEKYVGVAEGVQPIDVQHIISLGQPAMLARKSGLFSIFPPLKELFCYCGGRRNKWEWVSHTFNFIARRVLQQFSDGNAAIERAPVAALQQKIMQYLTPSRGSGRVETE